MTLLEKTTSLEKQLAEVTRDQNAASARAEEWKRKATDTIEQLNDALAKVAEVTRERDEARYAAKVSGDTLANAKMRADWAEALLEKKLRAGPEEERFAIDGILCKTNEHEAVISAERFRANKAEAEAQAAREAMLKAVCSPAERAQYERLIAKERGRAGAAQIELQTIVRNFDGAAQ